MLRTTMFSLLMLIAFAPAFAQTRCPMGVQAGSMQCLPDEPQGGGNAPARPTGEWIKTWGAIAHSSTTGEAGSAVGKLSESEAEQAALRQCAIEGTSDCKVSLTYYNQCAALVASDSQSFFQASVSERRSIKLAKESCEDSDSGTCKVIYSECTEPIFWRY
ncbi:hypothetical protein PSCICN_20810 [Pseudomonas cichorii]|uniref:DUF4189 domain-containing protein n=1 Tax=Pseudomonas cichorii TaxID=36746 RepID=UPI0019105D32|nr:DUF4189 domain-containing protein [Pseudomonas cichorii]GFM81389.1 hypothetical protein PSCICN_20810 [Pseudomonas cichorii]